MSESSSEHSTLTSQLHGLTDAPCWYVAFSGGLDSTVLLHMLTRWVQTTIRSRSGSGLAPTRKEPAPNTVRGLVAPPISAIHINHAMQNSAPDMQRHCEQLCARWQVPIITQSVEVAGGASREASAREARYRAFEALLPPAGILFLGHHLDDQVETFFLRLMRGAGVQGLAAMPSTRALGAGKLVRPLLGMSRSQLEAYAAQHSLDYIQDPSNSDSGIDRNFLRNEVLPLLASRWPAYRQTVARASGHLAAAAEVLNETLGRPSTVYSVLADPGVAVADLLGGSGLGAAGKLRAWLLARRLRAPDTAALREFLRQLRSAAADASPQLRCSDYTLQRYGDAVYLLPVFDSVPPATIKLRWGETAQVPGVGNLVLQRATAVGLQVSAQDDLHLAWRVGGEQCQLPGRAGSRPLKKRLQEWQVPPWWRDRVPLLYLGDELLAIAGFTVCQSSRLRDAGDSLWQIEWQRPENVAFD